MTNGQCEAVLNPPQRLRAAASVAEASDGQLLARFAACRDTMGEVAFEALVRRHGPMVLRVCHQVLGDRHRAEDAFQATFLILARRAGSIRQPERLGNWLHGVALRTAREARMRDDRRRRRESPASDSARVEEEAIGKSVRPEQELARREEFEALHEEVSRLPERYRGPVVLCDLEGLTHQEAAHRLRCPLSTIGVRLMRARERLRARLTRRGLAPTAGLLGALLYVEDATARLSHPLVDSTVRAAMGFASGPAATVGLVPAPVIALTQGVLRTMALGRLKAAAGLAVAIGIAACLWLVPHHDTRVVAAGVPVKSEPQDPAPPPAQPSEPVRAKPLPEETKPSAMDPDRTILAGPKAPAPPSISEPNPAFALVALLGPVGPAAGVAAAAARPAPPKDPERARGELLFAKEWGADDPGSHGGDGLGPLYNDTSCVACHGLGAPGGAGPESKNVLLVTAARNGCGPSSGLDQLLPALSGARSAVLHRYSTDPEYAAWRSRLFAANANGQPKAQANGNDDPIASRILAAKERTSPAGRMRERSVPSAPSSMTGFNLNVVERNTPPLFGMGRIDEIPSDVLVAVASSQPAKVRGRVGRTKEGRIGRFGWKAQIPSLHEFVRVACANELGLEVPGHSQPPSPLSPKSKARGLDLTESDCDALVSYIRALPPPVVIDPDGPQGTQDMRDGRRLFETAGCATCHSPSLGDVRGMYSDLLLHDLGQSLSDPGSSYGIDGPDTPLAPTPREWRTTPLWGYRDSGPYLHDGRAQDLEEAVALHEGQAQASARQFFSLTPRERAQVESFLKSLVAPASAAAPGVMLAADLESRIAKQREPEERMRRQREEAVARDQQKWKEAKRREREQEALKRIKAKLPIARSLERQGRTRGAITFYREIAREAPNTDEGRQAAQRINALTTRDVTP